MNNHKGEIMMTNHGVGKLTGCGLNGNAAMVPSNLHGGVSNQAVRDDNDMPRLLQADVFNNCMESAHNALNELSCQIEVFAQNSSFVMRPAEPGPAAQSASMPSVDSPAVFALQELVVRVQALTETVVAYRRRL